MSFWTYLFEQLIGAPDITALIEFIGLIVSLFGALGL